MKTSKARSLSLLTLFESVRHVMKSLLADFDILMDVAGFSSLDQIDRSSLGSFASSVTAWTKHADHPRILAAGLSTSYSEE